MKTISFITILLISIICISCDKDSKSISGEGPIITKTLTLTEFTGIDLSIATDITITQGTSQQVTAIGHENIIDRLSTTVSNEFWDVKFTDGTYKDYELTINITIPNIDEAMISGVGAILIEGFENQGDLFLNISGSGAISLSTFDGCENLSIVISGDGSIIGRDDFSTIKNLNISISGAGDFEGYPIQPDNCSINISGVGNCNVYAKETLNINISGVGNINYKGDAVVTKNVSGVGNIVKID